MDGFLFVDKRPGPSSFAVVKQVRGMLGGARAGHAGTLDPLASGLLVLALGDATRLLEYLPGEPKRYGFGMRFGTETDTLDSDGTAVAQGGRVPAGEELQEALKRFCGAIRQTPPKFSAVHVNGERAYDLARRKQEFELTEREVSVFSLTLASYDTDKGEASLVAECSGGTYVRSLVRDIAHSLGTLAYASFIRRLAVGPFTVETAVDLDKVTEFKTFIVPIQKALASLPQVMIDDKQRESLKDGKNIPLDHANETVMAFEENGDIAAVLKKTNDGLYHPAKVFVNR